MSARKAQLAGLAAILALTTTAGCRPATSAGHDTATAAPSTAPSTAPASAAPPDPRLKLIDAVPDEGDAAYHFTVTGGDLPMTGVLDAPHRAALVKIDQHQTNPDFDLAMTLLVIGRRTWVKVAISPSPPGFPKLPKKWQLLDAAKVKDKSMIGYDSSADPGYAQLLVQKAAGVKETSPGQFAGAIDLTRTTDAEIVDAKTLKKLGAKAKAVPFTATTDAKGNLTSLIVKVPAAAGVKAKTYAVKYDGFGTTPAVAAPAAGEQQKAASVIYQMLAG
jgi:hypothetical protein